jgi:transcription elongation GreA/GreB family factor
MGSRLADDIKYVLQERMFEMIELQIGEFEQSVNSIIESKVNETKSSAGDKFETGRAMMQLELDKIESQLDQLKFTKNQLKQIPSQLTNNQVALGSLVVSDKGNFYISVSLGKVDVDGQNYFTLSAQAPLSKVMLGKRVGETVKMRDRNYKIMEIR